MDAEHLDANGKQVARDSALPPELALLLTGLDQTRLDQFGMTKGEIDALS